MENIQQDSFLQMNLDHEGANTLRETARWSRFLSIVGIIGLSLGIIAFTLASSALVAEFSRLSPGFGALESLGGAFIITCVLGFIALFGFIVYMLYRFSVLTRKGIELQDQALFAEGMKCLKIYFLASGIISVISLLFNMTTLTKIF